MASPAGRATTRPRFMQVLSPRTDLKGGSVHGLPHPSQEGQAVRLSPQDQILFLGADFRSWLPRGLPLLAHHGTVG